MLGKSGPVEIQARTNERAHTRRESWTFTKAEAAKLSVARSTAARPETKNSRCSNLGPRTRRSRGASVTSPHFIQSTRMPRRLPPCSTQAKTLVLADRIERYGLMVAWAALIVVSVY